MSASPLAALQDAALIVLAFVVAAGLARCAIALAQRSTADPARRWHWRLLCGLSLVAALVSVQLLAGGPFARAAAQAAGGVTWYAGAALLLTLAGTGIALWIAGNLHRLNRHRQPPACRTASAFAALALLLLDYAGGLLTDGPAVAIGTVAAVGGPLALLAGLALRRPLRAACDARRQQAQGNERQRLAEQERLRLLALRDPLTGLGNRAAFQQEVADFIREANRSRGSFDLYHCDIRFAANTSHLLSGQALASLATRLRAATRADDRLIHYGEGQFVLLCARTGDGRAVRPTPVRERLLAACTEPVLVDRMRLTVAAEIGMATYPDDGATARQLMTTAAMRSGEHQRVVALHGSAA